MQKRDEKSDPNQDWSVDSHQIYSLDRCFKCINVLNLGELCFCTVKLKKTKPAEKTGKKENP